MKKTFLFAVAILLSVGLYAQTRIHLWLEGNDISFALTRIDSITFSGYNLEEEEDRPNVSAPDADHVTIVANIKTTVCDKVWLEGPFNGWSIATEGDRSAAALTPVDGYAGWYQVTLPVNGFLNEEGKNAGTSKILLSGADGVIPSDWSSQWVDVALIDGPAEVGSENYDEPTLIIGADAAAGVVYLTVGGFKVSPCLAKETYATVTFNLTIPEPVETGVFLHGPFVDDAWNGIAMTKVDDTHYTITVENLDQFTEYQYTLAADNWDEKGLFLVDGVCNERNRLIGGAVINDEVTGFASGCPTEEE